MSRPTSSIGVDGSPSSSDRIRRTIWVGLLVVVGYIVFSAVLGNILGNLADDDTGDFALSHLIPLPIAIALMLLFVRRSEWTGIWSETPTLRMRPRRIWLAIIPISAVALPLGQVADIDWGARAASAVLIFVVGTILVGFGEELAVRGILVTAVRGHHGEFVTMVVTSVTFGLAHMVGSIWGGVPLSGLAFQIGALTLSGVAYYWMRRVTGKLWVGIAVHALTDCVLYLTSPTSDTTAALVSGSEQTITNLLFVQIAQGVLIIASVLSIGSVIREDRRNRRQRTSAAQTI